MVFCCCLSFWFLLTGLITVALFLLSKKDPPKIAGVYCQPGKFYYLKLVAFYLIMKIRMWKDSGRESSGESPRDHTNLATYNSGYGTKSKNSPIEMDKIQPLSDHFLAIDAIYFNGANADGFCIVNGFARRAHGAINGFLIFRIPEMGYLVSPKFPDVMLFGGSSHHFGAEGFRYDPVVPMKHWKISYDGKMKLHGNESRTFTVSLKGDWKSNLPYFDYDTMIPPWTMARAIAKETWSREYFQMLKEAHQTHYEQHGNLVGEIQVDGKTYKFDMPSMRDHSYGVKRDWKLLHRYIFHMFSLEDGRRFDIGNVCQPVTSSRLELGYMYEADGSLHALESVDLPLEYLGELGTPPVDYAMRIKATNGQEYFVQVKVLDTLELYMGFEWEAKIVERRCTFVVDGVEGHGISECHYRNPSGRPQEHSKFDPEWTTTIKVA